MSEWKEYKLKDLTAKIGSGATPTGGGNAYKLEGISLIRSQNVLDFQFSYDGLAFIDEEQANGLKNVIVNENDVLLNITGDSVARACKVPSEILPARVNQHVCILRADEKNLNSDYLLYFLQANKELLLSLSEIGGTRNALTKAMIEELNILAPKYSEQQTIAEVLSSLDDKIDLLNRQNETLENIAKSLYQQWFIKEAEEDWKELTLKDIAEHCKSTINPSNTPNQYFLHYSLPAFDDGKLPQREIGKEILSNKYRVIPNSILISKLNPRFPRIWALYGNEIDINSICSTEFQIVKPKQIKYFGFIYCFLSSNQITQELAGASSGTSGSHQRVSPNDIFNLNILLPPEDKIEKFDSITKDYWIKIKSNTNQIHSLAQLRDTLLPKLMNSEVTLAK